MTAGLPSLSLSEQVLLWLDHVESGRGQPGLHVTQVGIANATGLSRGHVSRTLAPLLRRSFVVQTRQRVAGFNRALVSYHLTATGREQVQQLRASLGTVVVSVRRAGIELRTTSLADVLTLRGAPSLWEAVRQLSSHGSIDLEIGAVPPGSPDFVRDLTEMPPPVAFVGRGGQLHDLAAWMEARASVMVVEGPGGIGKTTFVAHAIRTSPPRRHTLWLRIMAFWTIREPLVALDRFLRRLGRLDSFPDAEEIEALQDHLRGRFKGQPVLLVVDDVDKARPEVQSLVEALVRLAEASPQMKLVLIGRHVQLPGEPLRRAVHRRLPALSDTEAEQMVSSRGPAFDPRGEVVRAAGGNPLFLELLLRAPATHSRITDFARFLASDLAPSLPAAQWDTLKWVSALRTPVSAEALGGLGVGSPAGLAELVGAGLLVLREDGQFDMHDLVREGLYDQIEFEERRRIHAGLAEMHRPREEGSVEIVEFLHHLSRAGRRDEAVRWIMRNQSRIMEQADELFSGP